MEENNGEVAIVAPIETAALPTPEQMQFQRNMAMAFGETIPNFEVPAPAETTEIHTQAGSEPWPIIDDNNQAALPTDYLKELGFETIDAAK